MSKVAEGCLEADPFVNERNHGSSMSCWCMFEAPHAKTISLEADFSGDKATYLNPIPASVRPLLALGGAAVTAPPRST